MFRNAKSYSAFHIVFMAIIAAAFGCATLALITTKAKAQTVSTYVGLHAGYGMATTEMAFGGVSLDGIGSKGLMGGVHGGVDLYFQNSPWLVGVWGAYDWAKIDTKLTGPGFSGSARLGDAWSIGGRMGLVIGKLTPFVMLGYKQQETSLSISGVSMPTLKGLVYGAGADYALAQNLKVGAQATITKFDDAAINTTGISMKPEALEVTLRASLSFGGPVATPAASLK